MISIGLVIASYTVWVICMWELGKGIGEIIWQKCFNKTK